MNRKYKTLQTYALLLAGASNPLSREADAAADVDQDGRDEIVYGSMVVDDNGH